ncbi:hypothetical protein EMMF5_005251 [Cystobasidiomycetes sp. EMM_F5]
MAVLGSKKLKPRVLTLQANELLPLETALKAAEKLVKMAGPKDVMFIGVSWNAAWLHLLANMRFIEIVCVISSHSRPLGNAKADGDLLPGA